MIVRAREKRERERSEKEDSSMIYHPSWCSSVLYPSLWLWKGPRCCPSLPFLAAAAAVLPDLHHDLLLLFLLVSLSVSVVSSFAKKKGLSKRIGLKKGTTAPSAFNHIRRSVYRKSVKKEIQRNKKGTPLNNQLPQHLARQHAQHALQLPSSNPR